MANRPLPPLPPLPTVLHFPSLLNELKSLGERSGAALGDAYAQAASVFLDRWEQLEDLGAERRFRRRPEPSLSPKNPPASAK